MRRIVSLLLITVLMFSLIVGCAVPDNSSTQNLTGSFCVKVDTEAPVKTILPSVSEIEVASYKLVGRLDETNTVDTNFVDKSFTVNNLKVGTWTFYAIGYNADGTPIARSQDVTVSIQADQTVHASLLLNYYEEGNGTFIVNFNVAEANTLFNRIVISLKNVDTTKPNPADISITKPSTSAGGYYTYQNLTTIPVGNYDVVATAYDGETAITVLSMESLYIFKDISSTYSKVIPELNLNMRLSVPVFSLATGTYNTDQSLIITQAENADIHYTTDGSTPTASSPLYSSPISVDRTMTVKAMSVMNGFDATDVVSGSYTMKVATLSASNVGGTFTTSQTLSFSTSTPNASIYYTFDGSTPSATHGTLYTGALTINESKTVKAIAIREGWTGTAVKSVSFTIKSSASFLVTDPLLPSTLTITVPDEWKDAESIEPGVTAVLTAQLSHTSSDTQYKWYVDGALAANGKTLNLGTEPGEVNLNAGSHLISCKAKENGKSYTEEYLVFVYPSIDTGCITHNYVHNKCSVCGEIGTAYAVGDYGPAGGWIFYDKGEYSDGWRYLEAAPTDIKIITYDGFIFGYCRASSDAANEVCGTDTAIGTGKMNTENLVARMGESAYLAATGTNLDSRYAAKLCLNYVITVDEVTYDDWFLPSKDELCEMYKVLKCEGGSNHGSSCPDKTHAATSSSESRASFGSGNASYWSSSENNSVSAYIQNFYSGSMSSMPRTSSIRIKAVRAF